MAVLGWGPEGMKMIQNTSCVEFNGGRKSPYLRLKESNKMIPRKCLNKTRNKNYIHSGVCVWVCVRVCVRV